MCAEVHPGSEVKAHFMVKTFSCFSLSKSNLMLNNKKKMHNVRGHSVLGDVTVTLLSSFFSVSRRMDLGYVMENMWWEHLSIFVYNITNIC